MKARYRVSYTKNGKREYDAVMWSDSAEDARRNFIATEAVFSPGAIIVVTAVRQDDYKA